MINPTDLNTTMFNAQGKNLENLKKYSDVNKVENPKDETLKKAAKDFEAVFVAKLLDVMDSTVEKSEFLRGGAAEDTFKSMLNQEIAKSISSSPTNSFGFAKQVYEQMKNRV